MKTKHLQTITNCLALGLCLSILPVFGQNAIVGTLAGSGIMGFADGPSAFAKFAGPTGVATDTAGNVYVADTYNNRIRKIDPSGNVSTLAGKDSGFADGQGANAKFNAPSGVVTDRVGNVYVADLANQRIRKIDQTGNVSTLGGNGTRGFVDGPLAYAQFNGPSGIAIDAAGNLYVADQFNNCIRKIGLNGNVGTLAGNGRSGFADGPAANAQFYYPYSLATDAGGNVYVADLYNRRVRKIDNLGNVSTLAGNGIIGFADGPRASALFFHPDAVATDGLGNVFVMDNNNQRVRKIDPLGMVSTLAGDGNYGFADGPAANAQFNYPLGLASDVLGNVYVADAGNHRIRKITINPSATQTLSPTKTSLEVYPNPIKEQTSIRFQLSKPESVSVKIQNALGHEVFTKKFISETGLNEITWNRAHWASGTYIVSLQTEGGVQTVKMVVE